MRSGTLDDRTFETTVEQSPEEAAASAAYFKDKGYAVTVQEEDEAGNKKPAEVTDPAKTTPPTEEVPLVDGTPVEADILAEHAEIATKNDGERLGYNARRTRKIKELEEGLAKETAKREQLEKLLEAKPAAEAKSSAFQPPAPVAPPAVVETKAAEIPPADTTIKPKEFDKPRPVRPTLEKFQDEADPYAALTAAGVEYAETLSDWKDEKREFDSKQTAEVTAKAREVEDSKNRTTEFHSTVNKRFEDIRRDRPDFDKATEGKTISPIMRFLLVGFPETGLEATLPDGLELAYQLSLPENADTFKELFDSTQVPKGEDQRATQARIDTARAELIAFRKDLKRKAAAAPVKTEKPAEAVAAIPPAEPTKIIDKGTPTPAPSNGQPRREEASPVPTRGRGVTPTIRPEDIDPMDSDARRELRRQTGELHDRRRLA